MKKSTAALLVFIYLWLLLVLVFYYRTHKPFSPDQAIHLGIASWRIIASGLLVWLAGGIGFRILKIENLHPLAQLFIQASLGLGILGSVYFLVGATIGMLTWLAWVALIVLGVIFYKSSVRWFSQSRSLAVIWKDCDILVRILFFLIAGMFFVVLAVALAPPIKYDALVYHLTLPKLYLQHNRVVYIPELVQSGYPQLGDMLFTWAYALAGPPAAATLGWMTAGLTTIGLLGAIRQHLPSSAALAGAASLLAGPTLVLATSWAYIDWFGLMFGMGCLISLDSWIRNKNPLLLSLAGAFAGLALSTKYTSIMLVVIAGLIVLWQIWVHRIKFWPSVLSFIAPVIICILPWLIKNILTTGNPIYPLFFTSGEMDAVRRMVTQYEPPYGTWVDFFLLPLTATLWGVEYGPYDVSIGPLLLGLSVFSWTAVRSLNNQQRSNLKLASAFALLGILLWAIANQFSGQLIQTRLYYFLFPAFAVLAAYGYSSLTSIDYPKIRISRIINVILLIILVLNTLEIAIHTIRTGAPQVISGLRDDDSYIAENLGWFQPVMQAINSLPQGSRALMIYETRSFYCQPVCTPDEVPDRWMRDYARYGTSTVIINQWQQQGFTHLLVHRSGVEFFKQEKNPNHPIQALLALDSLLTRLPEPVRFGNAYELYTLEDRR